MRQLIVDLKAEYADFTDGEIAVICAIQFSGRRPSQMGGGTNIELDFSRIEE